MALIPVSIVMKSTVEDEGTTVTRYDGLLRIAADGEIRLSYQEEEEGVRTATLLTLLEDEMTLSRHGGVEFATVFRVGTPHTSLYSLGGLRLDATVVTEHLCILRGTALPAADCRYRLTLGGEERLFTLSFRLEKREVAK
jgi:uncharacterized beta-barrel protein YwiB (DUF1934 family)